MVHADPSLEGQQACAGNLSGRKKRLEIRGWSEPQGAAVWAARNAGLTAEREPAPPRGHPPVVYAAAALFHTPGSRASPSAPAVPRAPADPRRRCGTGSAPPAGKPPAAAPPWGRREEWPGSAGPERCPSPWWVRRGEEEAVSFFLPPLPRSFLCQWWGSIAAKEYTMMQFF